MNDDDEENQKEPDTLESLFDEYSNVWAKFYENPIKEEEPRQDHILLSQSDLWMINAQVIRQYFTIFETGSLWFEIGKLRLTFDEYMNFIGTLCEKNHLDSNEIKAIMLEAGPPENVQII